MPLAELIALVAPPRCGACGRPCTAREPLCGACEAAIAAARPRARTLAGLDAVWSAAPYEGAARELVAALKFAGRLRLAKRAAQAIAAAAPAPLVRGGAIVPVPAAPARLRRRGFDPAAEIALALAALGGLPLSPCLRRPGGPRQVGRSRAERVADPPRVRAVLPAPRRALLVDDVVTTGATLAACARALREAGCGGVVAVTFAAS